MRPSAGAVVRRLLLRANIVLCVLLVLTGAKEKIVLAVKCFTCAGPCFKADLCNCHTNMCQGEACFSEISYVANRRAAAGVRDMTADGQWYLVKGCLKRPPEVRMGCDFRFSRYSIYCVCDQDDFCNDHFSMPPLQQSYTQWNTSCFDCAGGADGGPNCEKTCQGEYCYAELNSGRQTCGYGAPILQFTRRSEQLFANAARETCTTTVAGTQWRTECVCHSHGCNKLLRDGAYSSVDPRTVAPNWRSAANALSDPRAAGARAPRLYKCHSCAIASGDPIMPAQCTAGERADVCWGQYCTLVAESRQMHAPSGAHLAGKYSVSRVAGCLNTSAAEDLTLLGCSQKWHTDKRELVECVCRGDYCNSDLHRAHLNAARRPRCVPLALLMVLLLNVSRLRRENR